MAKVTFLQGKARGKVGGIVYRTEAGLGTIASEYNPSPRNPRTVAQTKQRAKMNLAGQISKVTPYAAFAGLGSTRRDARSKFVSKLLYATSVDETNAQAKVAYENVVLSVGRSLPVVPINNMTVDSASHAVTLNLGFDNTNLNANVIGVLGVVYLEHPSGKISCIAVKSDEGTTQLSIPLGKNTDIDFPTVEECYIIPISDEGVDARVAYGNLDMSVAIGNQGFMASYVRTLVSAGAYCESIYAGMPD